MEGPLELTFRGIPEMVRPALTRLVEEKVHKLEKICPAVTSCHVALEQVQKSHRKGNPFHVRLDVHIKGKHEIVVKRDAVDTNWPALIREAFDAAQRQAVSVNEKMQGKIKDHGDKSRESVLPPEQVLDTEP